MPRAAVSVRRQRELGQLVVRAGLALEDNDVILGGLMHVRDCIVGRFDAMSYQQIFATVGADLSPSMAEARQFYPDPRGRK